MEPIIIDRDKIKETIKKFLSDDNITRNSILYIYGDPGAGKSTLRNFLEYSFEEGELANKDEYRNECAKIDFDNHNQYRKPTEQLYFYIKKKWSGIEFPGSD